MQKVFNVAVDIGRKLPAPAFEVNTNDLKSVKLIITITNGQSLLNLTDTTVRIAIRKPDNHIIFQDCAVKDATNGQVEIILENQAYITPGTHTAEIMCYKGNEVVAVSGTFSYKSTKGIMNDEAVESKSEFTAINQKIEEAKKLLEDAAESGVGVDEQARQDIQEVNAQLADTSSQFNKFADPLTPYFQLYEPILASNEWVTDSTGKVLNMSTTQFLARFYDPLVGNHANGYTVTKRSRGKDHSGQFDLWEYDFKPANYTKVFLLSSGLHPYELPAIFGLAHFMNDLMATQSKHDGFKQLRENVRIKIIPICNPWGFNQNPKTYGNVNGVNINRNFDYDGRWADYAGNTTEWNQKGSAPFSEKETQILRDWAIENKNALFWIDCHTGLENPAFDTWFHYISGDPAIPTMMKAVGYLDNRIRNKYKRSPKNNIVVDSEGSIRQFYVLRELGLSTMTLEFSELNWGTRLNNEGIDITEYEVLIAAFVFSFLGLEGLAMQGYINSVENKFTAFERKIAELELKLQPPVEPGDIIVKDTFDRTDSDTLGNAETGQTWVNSYFGTSQSGKFGIVNGKAVQKVYDPDGNRNYVETGVSDYHIEINLNWSVYAGFHFRYVDAKNHLLVRLNNTGVGLFKSINGASIKLAEHLFTPVQGKDYTFKAIANGSLISVYLDNQKIMEVADDTHLTATKVGLRTTNDSVSKFDSIEIREMPV